MGCGLCHGPAAAPISKLRELYCNTAGIQAHCLVNAAVVSCSIWIRTGWLQKSPFPGCSRMACGENRAGVCCMQRMRSMSYLVVLFLPLLIKATAPSWAWGHQLVTLDILGASSSWLFLLSCMLFHCHWALSCVLQKSFPSCLLLKGYSAHNPPSKIPGGSQTGVSRAALLQMLV